MLLAIGGRTDEALVRFQSDLEGLGPADRKVHFGIRGCNFKRPLEDASNGRMQKERTADRLSLDLAMRFVEWPLRRT